MYRSLLSKLVVPIALMTWSAHVSCGAEQALFNGKDLSEWDYFLVDPAAKMSDVWSIQDGILVCKGEPQGYLATKKDYTNFTLVVEWRWAPGTKPGNSGVLMRITGQARCCRTVLRPN